MRKWVFITILLLTVVITPSLVSAQGMMGLRSEVSSDGHTAREEAEGKEIWEKLQTKKLQCEKLIDDNFAALGEYYMGTVAGKSHGAMNNMMIGMMGEKGEKNMHIVMGKRMSGCDSSAALPQNLQSMMSGMMSMMMGSTFAPESFGGTKGGGNPMMDGSNGFGILGWVPMLLFWLLLILGVAALFRYLGKSGQHDSGRTPLEILKERYAKGEISKKEFEEMKKEVNE